MPRKRAAEIRALHDKKDLGGSDPRLAKRGPPSLPHDGLALGQERVGVGFVHLLHISKNKFRCMSVSLFTLAYKNPHVSLHGFLSGFKHHPMVAELLGKRPTRISLMAARAIPRAVSVHAQNWLHRGPVRWLGLAEL